MALRCLLFSSDEGTATPICQALAGLGIEAEYCPAAVEAVAKITTQPFQIVIVDWDNQPEAGLLLNTARERKAAERPLTLAVVGNDIDLSHALQAGANSILRKPIQPNQVRETLTTARDLLRSRLDSSAPVAQAAAAAAGASSGGALVPLPEHQDPGSKKTVRAGEFLRAESRPGAQFDIESEARNSFGYVAASEIDALKELEPMAASVETKAVDPEIAPHGPSERHGLRWYLNGRAGTLPTITSQPPAPNKAELLDYDQTPSHNQASPPKEREQKTEAALFGRRKCAPGSAKLYLWLH